MALLEIALAFVACQLVALVVVLVLLMLAEDLQNGLEGIRNRIAA